MYWSSPMGARKNARPRDCMFWRTMTNEFLIGKKRYEELVVFDQRFSRCYRLLHFIACRVLGGPDRAENAVANCWLRASQNPPQFKYEGEFRSWLLRVLIDEALAILGEDQGTHKSTISLEPICAQVLPVNY
jgi:DNA-directed RNA polymerase specialized sigma24 family protein